MSSSSLQHAAIELDTIASSIARRPGPSSWEDREPLLPRSFSPSYQPASPSPGIEEDTENTLTDIALAWIFSLLPISLQEARIVAMSRFRGSKASRFMDKLQTESEPGLTNAQLMLTNHDLKPVEPERRQWGPWNFVGMLWSYARCR